MKPVGILACCKKKGKVAAKAADLYQGALFKLSLEWLSRNCSEVAILSAKHGLLMQDQVIEPYDQVFKTQDELDAWALLVMRQIKKAFPERKLLVILDGPYLAGIGGIPHERVFTQKSSVGRMRALKKALEKK